MTRFGLAVALSLAAASAVAPAVAEETSWDNPGRGDAPCLVLHRYVLTPVGGSFISASTFRADATVGNMCGRSLEVALCFVYAEPVDGSDRSCFSGVIRPGGTTAAASGDTGVLITGPEFRWRWMP